jgi:type IV secretory pathway ATPase VirB11/archaellum biosynthesis ATPase
MTDTKPLWPEVFPSEYLEGLKRDMGSAEWKKFYLCNPWEEETTMTFEKGYFNIVFSGPQAAGKTVALNKVMQFLQREGYSVSHSRTVDRDHTLSVTWSK